MSGRSIARCLRREKVNTVLEELEQVSFLTGIKLLSLNSLQPELCRQNQKKNLVVCEIMHKKQGGVFLFDM